MIDTFTAQIRTIVVCLLSILIFDLLSVDYANFTHASKNADTPSAEIGSSPTQIPDLTFVSAGDFGCTQEANMTVNGMVDKNPDLMLALGDLSYERDGACWFKLISPLDTLGKVRIAIGTHDIDPDLSRYREYLTHFNLTKPYYSYDYQNVHFLAMATGKEKVVSYFNTSEQYRFIEKDLKNAHDDNTIDWIIVYGFRPFYSSNSTHPGSDRVRETYHPLFDKYGVDIVLQAHNHNYQRTYPLEYNEENNSNPIVSDKNKREYRDDMNAPIFVTVGTAGQPLHSLTGREPYIVTEFLSHGFLTMQITNNGSNLTATFNENEKGKVKDVFSIIKVQNND